MRSRSLGPDTVQVGVVGYGGWPLSDSDPRPTEADAVRVIHTALDGGATLVDTADAYCLHQGEAGHNERLVGKALKSWSGPRDDVTVATKGGFVRPDGVWKHCGRPEHLREACDRSLLALDVERIDLYQLHAPDPDVPFDESLEMLAELQGEGKIRWVGLSNVSVAQIEQARGKVEIVSVQNRLNPFFREAVGDGVVDYCDQNDLGFLAYSPVGGGRLNTRLPDIEALAPIAKRYGCSHHAIVLAWVLAKGSSVIVIPAARREAHVTDSQIAASIELSEAEMQAIDHAEFSIA